MRIAIIGTGNVGRALATSFTHAGHEVALASRDPQHAADLAATLDHATAAASSRSAAQGADGTVLPAPQTEPAAGEVGAGLGPKLLQPGSRQYRKFCIFIDLNW